MKKLLLIPLLLFCVTAFGQWTKPQLYSNINTNIRLKTYSPLRIAAVLDSIVDTMNTGAAGIGGSTGSVDNAILRADGTGGATLQSSGVSIQDDGDIDIGTDAGPTRTIQATGSASDVSIQVLSKGSSDAVLANVGTGRARLTAGGGWELSAWNFTSGSVPTNNVLGNSTSGTNSNNAGAVLIRGGTTTSTVSNRGGDVTISSGIGNGTNSSSGHIYIDIGASTGSGVDGNIGYFTNSIADWKSLEKGFFEGNVTTVPSAEPTSGIFRYVGAEPEGSNMVIFNPNGYTAKPILVARGTISGGATLRGIGSTPQTLIAAPGSGKYINVISVSVSYNYGTTVYDFSGTEVPVFKYSGGSGSAFAITVTAMNSGADFNRSLGRYNINSSELGGISSPDNTGFVITTDDGGNATTGDGSLSYVIYFTIETTNN